MLPPTACPACRRDLDVRVRSGPVLTCTHCGAAYPCFNGRIPVLVKDWENHLAASYSQIRSLIDWNEELLRQVDEAKMRQPERAALLEKISLACLSDSSWYEELLQPFTAHLPDDRIAQLKSSGKTAGLYSLQEAISFYHRDWCRSAPAEGEIASLMDAVLGQARAHARAGFEAVFVPGAGAGRFAAEAAAEFDYTAALDSLHMAHLFHGLVHADRVLSEIHLRSGVVKREDVVGLNMLSVGPDVRSRVESGALEYWAGDALHAPFADASFSCVLSLYLIDVIPAGQFLEEAHRLLKPGGLFINLGPLRYARRDVVDMLCGEEVLDLVAESGFEILHSDTVPNTHLATACRITSIRNDNFLFAARKV